MSPFPDRTEAGRQLGARLAELELENPVILALPRGGLPVALEIARALHAPLELVMVRKIGVPIQPELAAAAVVDGGAPELVYNRDVMRAAGLDEGDIEAASRRELAEIERRRAAYEGGRVRASLDGRTVVVVDDGIATGTTMRAALAALRRKSPRRLVLAIPVAPADTVEELRHVVDDVVCLRMPEPFYAVGQSYRDFHQVTDAEVVEALREADRMTRAGAERDVRR
ncbi:MAG: phosphoribosyltransferase [Hyphomicrobiaceae bacterium]